MSDEWLTRNEVASVVGWKDSGTVTRMAALSRAKVNRGESLTPDDFPLPGRYVGRTPQWHAVELAAYVAARPGKGGGMWSMRRREPMQAGQVVAHDVVWIDDVPHLVRDRQVTDDAIHLHVTRGRRQAAQWVSLPRNAPVDVWRH